MRKTSCPADRACPVLQPHSPILFGDTRRPVGFALDRETIRRGDAALLKELPGRNEVVEGILLIRELSGAMPGSPVLSTTADAGDCHNPALLHPGEVDRVVIGNPRNSEAPVATEQYRAAIVTSLRHTLKIGTSVHSFER